MKTLNYRTLARLFIYVKMSHFIPREEDCEYLMPDGEMFDTAQLELLRNAFRDEMALMRTHLIEQGVIEG